MYIRTGNKDATEWFQKFLKIYVLENFNFTVLCTDIPVLCTQKKCPENNNILLKFPEIRKFPEKWYIRKNKSYLKRGT